MKIDLDEEKIIVAIYNRVSSEEQKQNCTIENQVRICKEFLKNKQIYEVYDYYKDDGVSGPIPFNKRPEGRRLLQDAKEGKFSLVIVTSTDRLGRSVKEMISIVDILSDIGVGFKSISEPYDTKTPEGRMMFNQFANFAEFELNHTKKRSKEGKERAIDEGRWVGGLPPYGYKVNKETKKLELYKDKVLLGKYSEVDVIKRIYDLCVNYKLTAEKIAERLNQEGIPPHTKEKGKRHGQKKAKYWSGPRVRNLIKEPIYKGDYIIGRRSNGTIKSCKKKVDCIVIEDIWEEAQRVLVSNIIQATRNAKYNYLLSGKLTCSECKRNFTGHNDHKIFYYICNNNRFKNKTNPYKCHNKAIRADVLEEEVWKDIKSIIKDPKLIKSYLEKRLDAISTIDSGKAIENAKKELRNIKRQKQNLVKRIKYGGGFLKDSIEKEIDGLKKNEEMQLKIIVDHQNIDKRMEREKLEVSLIEKALAQMIDKIENPEFKVKKEIVNILLEKVVVHPSDGNEEKRKVEIYYKFKENPSSTDILTLKR